LDARRDLAEKELGRVRAHERAHPLEMVEIEQQQGRNPIPGTVFQEIVGSVPDAPPGGLGQKTRGERDIDGPGRRFLSPENPEPRFP
ncbi:MAG TPA: hypothetical protein VIK87_11525, partial [Sphingomonadales bacterium]